ncbi:MAG: 50S ribosomal protein L2 [Parcubacteria group bacterium GW2011_GWB1_40_14]|nr:MAG: 50S ribosomal protein L2 [Parcubacteria group bacterium GW2011_GWB1_40_14]
MKIYKPTTPGRRGMTGIDYSEFLTRKKPEKSLTRGIKRKAGRNHQGTITVRFRGGGHKVRYRLVDFRQDKINIPANVQSIEYDPNRTAFIALISYLDGEKRYILAPRGLKVGDQVLTAEKTELKIGNRMMLKNIPPGSEIHNIELFPGKGGQMVRAAGSAAQILAHDAGITTLRMPSSEVRKVSSIAYASIGSLSNSEQIMVNLGKAGRKRWMGRMPHNRGTSMNPVDHPHGGGEGRSGVGLKYPKTPWGKHAHGVKTRNRKKLSNKYIVQRRSK